MFSVTYTLKTILTHQTLLMVIKTTNLYIFMLFYIGATINMLEVSKYPPPNPHHDVCVCFDVHHCFDISINVHLTFLWIWFKCVVHG